MKLRYKMEILDIDGSPMAVPVDGGGEFRGVLHMNSTAQDIIEMLKDDVTEDEIVAKLRNEYDATDEQMRHNVVKVLGILKEHELIC